MTKEQAAIERLEVTLAQLRRLYGRDVVDAVLGDRIAAMRKEHGDAWVDTARELLAVTTPIDHKTKASVFIDDALDELTFVFGSEIPQKALAALAVRATHERTTARAIGRALAGYQENQDDQSD